MSTRHAYNIVSDTVIGANVRVKDNVIQAIVTAVCLVVGAGVCAALFDQWQAGLFVGGFLGLVIGLFGSGIFLMIYRAVMHLRGHHD